MKYKIITLLLLTFLSAPLFFAQDKEKSVREKLKEIEGEVKSVTVETDKGRVEFKGEEAERVLERMKGKGRFFIDADIKGIGMGNMDSINAFFKWDRDSIRVFGNLFSDSFKVGMDSMMFYLRKNMDSLKIELGNIKVDSILRSLPKMNDSMFASRFGNNRFKFKMFGPDGDDRVIMIFPREDMDDDELDIIIRGDAFKKGETKKIIIEEENGEKKVTVTTIDKEGKETVEVFSGSEADEYLKKEEVNERGGEKQKRIIIRRK